VVSKKRISDSLREAVLARDSRFVCVYCLTGRKTRRGRRVLVTLDHVLAESRKGKVRATNLVKCCLRCNGDKHNMHLDLWAQQLERDTGLAAGDTMLRVYRQQFATIPSE